MGYLICKRGIENGICDHEWIYKFLIGEFDVSVPRDITKVMDVGAIKINPTQRNKHVGEDRVPKRLHRFLLLEAMVGRFSVIKQWVGNTSVSNNFPIFLDICDEGKKLASPLKMSSTWLQEEDIIKLKENQKYYSPKVGFQVAVQFEENLNFIKKISKDLAFLKGKKYEQDIIQVERDLEYITSSSYCGYASQDSKDELL